VKPDRKFKLDRKFLGRLATYLLGVAIGLALLGLMQSMRPQSPAQTTSTPAP
jgi:hypothetical protein